MGSLQSWWQTQAERHRRGRRIAVIFLAVTAVALAGYSGTVLWHGVSPAPPSSLAGYPAAPGAPAAPDPASGAAAASAVHVCGDAHLLKGPAVRPKGAVRVPAGDNSRLALRPDTTYWLAPGVHTLGRGEFDHFDPLHGDTFIGAPAAILSGQDRNDSAFDGTATGVTIKYLTIENFTPPGSQGVVNHDSGPGWIISHNTIQDNIPGAGVMIGTGSRVTSNCFTRNGEYGFSAYAAGSGTRVSRLTGGPKDIALQGNEISYNDVCNFEDVSPDPVPPSLRSPLCAGAGQFDGCGCSGGGKFWEVQNAVIDGNYVHDNYDVGLWADTNNDGFIFRGNYIAGNYGPGVTYEISYNAIFEGNYFGRNGIGQGPTNVGFPTGAIYLSESGGDRRVPNSAGIKTITISGNTFWDNWSGVILWESADRFCGSPDNSSTGVCTLVEPKVTSIRTCNRKNLAGPRMRPDYYDLCRWKTQNVLVTRNKFGFDKSAVVRCRGQANSCGQNGIFSQFGSSPDWSPYKGFVIAGAITTARNNKFSANIYTGPWTFIYHDQSEVLSLGQWRARGQD